jgi:anti-anti-sigma factor
MVEAAMFRPHSRMNDCVAAPFSNAGPLRFVVERVESAVVLRVGGDIDASNIAAWQCLLNEVAGATAAPGPLVVDTTSLNFMGACGFAALATTSKQCRRRGITLCVVGNQAVLARIIAACRWQTELPAYGNVSAALDACAQHTLNPAVNAGDLSAVSVSTRATCQN